jgi:hypothetical protein
VISGAEAVAVDALDNIRGAEIGPKRPMRNGEAADHSATSFRVPPSGRPEAGPSGGPGTTAMQNLASV